MTALASAFRAVIFYDDLTAVDRAMHTLRREQMRSGDRRTLEPSLWQVGLLGQAQWLRLAAAETATAGLCLVALSRIDRHANNPALWLHELAPRFARHWRVLPPQAPAPAPLQAD